MERAFEVTKMEEVFLYCDYCGTEMVKDGTAQSYVWLNTEADTYKPDLKFLGYLYKCPKCGAEQRNMNNYPYQRVHYNKPVATTENNSGGEQP